MTAIGTKATARAFCVAAALALSSGCGGPDAEDPAELVDLASATRSKPTKPPPPPPPPTSSVRLGFAATAPSATTFEPLAQASIDATPTLYVVADWNGVAADAVERLDVFMPGGALYASLDLPIAATTRGDLQFQVLGDGTRRLTYLLQVWGTPIESYRMTGSWSARASLVGGSASATASVVLE